MSSSDYNRIVSTVNSVSSNFSFVPDLNNVIVIDTSNNRIGINNTDPEYSLDISGDVENKYLGIKTPNLTICGGYVHSSLIPKNFRYTDPKFTGPSGENNLGNYYSLGDASNPWNEIWCVNGNFESVDLGANTLYIDGKAVMGLNEEGNLKLGYDEEGYDINLSAKFQDISINGNINFVGPDRTITSQSNIILDPSDNTGTVIIKGDLNVLGAQTTITSQTLEVSDNIITINKGNTNNNGVDYNAGIEIDRNLNNNQKLIWSNIDDKWKFIEENTDNLQNILANDLSVNNVDVNNHLFVKGDISLNSKLFVQDDVSLNSKLFVQDDVSLNSKLFVKGDVSLNSKLFVQGDVSFGSKLFVQGDVSFNSNVDISGNLILNGSLGVLASSINDISYGNAGALLTSNGPGNSVSWASPYLLRVFLESDQAITSVNLSDIQKVVNFGIDNDITTTNASSDFNTTTDKWTPPAGKYMVNLQFYFKRDLDLYQLRGLLYKNNDLYREGRVVQENNSSGSNIFSITLNINDLIYADGDDEFEFYVSARNAGQNLEIFAGKANTFFSAYKIA